MLQPWHKAVTPREDLRKGEPLDASEFAIDLEEVIRGTAHPNYTDPELFFSCNCFTERLKKMASQTLKRLSGEVVGTSPVINLITPFGGGKTHALTLLYHLAKNGDSSLKWSGVEEFLSEAGLTSVPRASVAVFVGDRFDAVYGREGRLTPWGEIAWQLGGNEAYKAIEEHDRNRVAPSGEAIERILPLDRPVLILMDEVLKYMSVGRAVSAGDSTLASQFYNFLSSLNEAISRRRGASLVTSLPKSTMEMTPEDEQDFARLCHLLGRKDWPIILTEGAEIAEIVRRRLFEDIAEKEKKGAAQEYGKWAIEHREQLPSWFPTEEAKDYFEAYYPFHPTVLSVFERKWQALPHFQKARGVLKMLALWVSQAYQYAFKFGLSNPIINLGIAPLEEHNFRGAIFEQLGEDKLQAAVLSDIAGEQAVAVRLDGEAQETIRRAQLHQKVARTIFFESSGGQVREGATLPEIRLDLGEPELDIGNIDTVLTNLTSINGCYHLHVEGPYYWYKHTPNINKLLADRRALISDTSVEEKIREIIRSSFIGGPRIFQRCYFPENSTDIQDTTMLNLIIMPWRNTWESGVRGKTWQTIENFIQYHGSSPRTFKNALFFMVAHSSKDLEIKARDILAIEKVKEEADQLQLSEAQEKQLKDMESKTQRDLREAVGQAYRHLVYLDEGGLKDIDLGLISTASGSLVEVIEKRLRQEGILEEEVTPRSLRRSWPSAFTEWSTKKLKEDFYASPRFPRLTEWQSLKKTIAKGVREGNFGYATKAADGSYEDVIIKDSTFDEAKVEFSEGTVILPKEEAEKVKPGKEKELKDYLNEGIISEEIKELFRSRGFTIPEKAAVTVRREDKEWSVEGEKEKFVIKADGSKLNIYKEKEVEPPGPPPVKTAGLRWSGEIPHQQWMLFFNKVLSRFVNEGELAIQVDFTVFPSEGISQGKIEETKRALKDLGLDENQVQEIENASYSHKWDKHIERFLNDAGKEGGEGKANP